MVQQKRQFHAKPIFLICIILLMNSCEIGRLAPNYSDNKNLKLSLLTPEKYRGFLLADSSEDVISKLYSDLQYTKSIREFFTTLTGSETVATAILDSAPRHSVPVDLAFSIAWEESMFRPDALHKNGSSEDRGLFQLNSKSFPSLSDAQAFDPSLNAEAALRYFGSCLENGKNEVAALAMYNAGHSRVKGSGTPKSTLDYIARIQNYRENLGKLFTARVVVRREFLDRSSLSRASTGY